MSLFYKFRLSTLAKHGLFGLSRFVKPETPADIAKDPDYVDGIEAELNKVVSKRNSKNTSNGKRYYSLTRLMGAGTEAIKPIETYFVTSTLTTPRKVKSAISSITTRTPEKATLTTPTKGAHSSRLYSPNGSAYDNQGKITILKTKTDGTQITTYCSLFFPSSQASKENRINFPASPPADFEKLQEHITNLHQRHADLSLPSTLKITLERIDDIHEEGKKRRPENKSVMGKLSAKDAAILGGLNISPDVVLQWLHVKAAYLAGKFDEKTNRSQSQVATNLILGTREGNAHMTVIEMAFKRILKKEALKIDEIHQSEVIEWVPGYENVIANVIHYKLSIPGCEITYDLDPWTLNKVPDNKEELIHQFVETVFSEALDEPKQTVRPTTNLKRIPFKLSAFELYQDILDEQTTPKNMQTSTGSSFDSGPDDLESTEPFSSKIKPSK